MEDVGVRVADNFTVQSDSYLLLEIITVGALLHFPHTETKLRKNGFVIKEQQNFVELAIYSTTLLLSLATHGRWRINESGQGAVLRVSVASLYFCALKLVQVFGLVHNIKIIKLSCKLLNKMYYVLQISF